MNFDFDNYERGLKRRAFLHQSAYGLGGMAFASLLDRAQGA